MSVVKPNEGSKLTIPIKQINNDKLEVLATGIEGSLKPKWLVNQSLSYGCEEEQYDDGEKEKQDPGKKAQLDIGMLAYSGIKRLSCNSAAIKTTEAS